MKYILLSILFCVLVLPVFGKEIILSPISSHYGSSLLGGLNNVFAGKSESIIGPFGDSTPDYEYSSGSADLGCNYNAPADCYIVGIGYIFGAGGTIGTGFNASIWSSDGGASPLPSAELGNFASTVDLLSDWQDIDITDLGLTLNNGDEFFAVLDQLGTSCRMSFDNNSGSYQHYVYTSGTTWLWSTMNRNMNVRVIINDDFDAPYADEQDPPDGEMGVPVDTDIVFHVKDDDVGVDSTSITGDSVVVTDDTKAVISGTLDVDYTDPNDVVVTFDPDNDFDEGVEVTVTVSPSGYEITDSLGNAMAEDSWSFTVFMNGIKSASFGEIKANFVNSAGTETAPTNPAKK